VAALFLASHLGTGPSTATQLPSQVPAAPRDARTILNRLFESDLPISNGAVQDETTDPNELLGRPHQYTSRASFDVPGADPTAPNHRVERGGAVEVFADAADAKARYEYLDGIRKAAPLLVEYDYVNGPVLVRITGKLKPSVAAQFEEAVRGL
jgi:hypothetical protein